MLTIVFFLFLYLLSGCKEVSAAETPLKLEQLIIQILPEHTYHPNDEERDSPPLLVGYHGTIKNLADEPRKYQINVPLPVESNHFRLGFVGAAGIEKEEITEIEYEFDEETGIISWETSEEIAPDSSYKFVIEFYTAGITESGEKKKLDYRFNSFTDIGLVHLIFVEPLETENFKLSPEPAMQQTNSSNLNMYSYIFRNVGTGENISVQLEYDRKEKRTTKEIIASMTDSGEVQSDKGVKAGRMPGWKTAAAIDGVTLPAAAVLVLVLWRRSRGRTTEVGELQARESERDIKEQLLRSMLSEGRITGEEYDRLIRIMKDGDHHE